MESNNSDSEEELLSLDDDSDEERIRVQNARKVVKQKPKSLAFTQQLRLSEASIDTSPVNVSISDDSDEEDSIETAQISAASQQGAGDEIILSDEESDNEGRSTSTFTSSLSSQGTLSGNNDGQSSSSSRAGYGLRRKRKINYGEIENGPEIDEVDDSLNNSKAKKDVLDIFSVSNAKIYKYVKNPDLVDRYTNCKIVFMDGTDQTRLDTVAKFFEACGQQFESLFILIRFDENNYSFLKTVFKHCSAVGRLDYRYQNIEDAFHLLRLIKDDNCLHSLMSLKLISVSGSETLREKHIALLSEMRTKLQSLELGDALWEDVKSKTIEKLLDNQKSCLETLIIRGGFKGEDDKEKKLISFPKMEALKTLEICPKYSFLSEFKNPHSKKARVISLEVFKKDEPFKVSIMFTCDLPNLRRLVLGNLVDIEDLVFSSVRKLTEFRCGSFWNLSIRFPSEKSRKELLQSNVSVFQFPDALKDPLFTVNVAKHFPHLKKVWLSLPSVPVLRAFFKAFENSNLEELYLKTQFDFAKTMESCLLPNMQDVLRKSPETETILRTLREYKHFDEYIRYYNVELPVEAEDLMEGHSAGIGALKNLKVLHLEHIPRKLLIPIPDDERKWYDHHCKFMSTTFGFESYPLEKKCHEEIRKLNLSEYRWINIQTSSSFTDDFHGEGFVNIPDVQVIREINASTGYGYEDEEEDIFTPVLKSMPKGTQIKIMPSMLFPNCKAKPEGV